MITFASPPDRTRLVLTFHDGHQITLTRDRAKIAHDPIKDSTSVEISLPEDVRLVDKSVMKRLATQMGWTPPHSTPTAVMRPPPEVECLLFSKAWGWQSGWYDPVTKNYRATLGMHWFKADDITHWRPKFPNPGTQEGE